MFQLRQADAISAGWSKLTFTSLWSKRVPRLKCQFPNGCNPLRNRANLFIPSIPGEMEKAVMLAVMSVTPFAAQPIWGRNMAHIAIRTIRASGIRTGGTIHSFMEQQAFSIELFIILSSASTFMAGNIYISAFCGITIY
jgi:hypothetical protein